MGVGLTICHGIIEDHQGKISASNAPGGGAVISIALPLHTAPPAPADQGDAVPAPAAGQPA
jgi:K+-sensing histidine kinase KdpD